jgi:hypothetical protein
MNSRRTPNLPLRLLLCATAALTLGGYAGAPALASTDGAVSAAAKPRLIVYAGGESPGVEVQSRADAKHLRGAPKAFKRFIGTKAQRLADQSTCTGGGYVGVTVERLRTDGFAVGGVNDCGGYAALWAVVNGHWKEIQGTQEIWSCGILKRHVVPSSVAGTSCYDYQHHKTRHYHQR